MGQRIMYRDHAGTIFTKPGVPAGASHAHEYGGGPACASPLPATRNPEPGWR